MHPLAEDFTSLKDAEIETRIQDLSKKYFATSNISVQHQISMFLDLYKSEIANRRARAWQQQYQNGENGLDKLINVN